MSVGTGIYILKISHVQIGVMAIESHTPVSKMTRVQFQSLYDTSKIFNNQYDAVKYAFEMYRSMKQRNKTIKYGIQELEIPK